MSQARYIPLFLEFMQ